MDVKDNFLQGSNKVRIEVSLSESYRLQREAASDLMTRMQAAIEDSNIEVIQSSWAGRRSGDDLIPLFVLTLTVIHAAGREIGEGFLQAIGAQGVGAVKWLLLLLAQSPEGSSPPEIRLELRSTYRRGGEETTREVMMSIPRWTGDDPGVLLDQVLERGFDRAGTVMQSDPWDWITYDVDTGQWLTQDERLEVQIERDREFFQPSSDECSET